MSRIPIGKARRLAKERIKDAMETYLNGEITAALAGSSYLGPPPMPGIKSGEGAVMLTDPDQPDALPRGHSVFVYIYSAGPRTSTKRSSGGILGYNLDTFQDFVVVLIFTHAMGTNVRDKYGTKVQADIAMKHRCDLYLEALVNTMTKHVPGGTSPISALEFTDDQNVTLYDEEFPVLGKATTTWRATQLTLVPNPDC